MCSNSSSKSIGLLVIRTRLTTVGTTSTAFRFRLGAMGLASSSPADSSTSTIAGRAAACRLDRHCPDSPGSLSTAPSCPVTGLGLVASFPFVIPQRVPFSGFRRVRICRHCTSISTHFPERWQNTPSGHACTDHTSSPRVQNIPCRPFGTTGTSWTGTPTDPDPFLNASRSR